MACGIFDDCLMLLFDLPTETLIDIFGYLDPEWLQEDHARLLISKRWYAFARTVWWKSLTLSASTLLQHSAILEDNAHLIRSNLISLKIQLRGNENWSIPTREDSPGAPLHVYNHYNEYWVSAVGETQLDDWTKSLNRNLSRLVRNIEDCSKLRELRLEIFAEVNPHIDRVRRSYVSSSNIRSLFQVRPFRHIRTMHLDLCGLDLEGQSMDAGAYHICAWIRPFLSSLHTLTVRSYRICAAAFTPEDDAAVIFLKELVVNLCLFNESPGISPSLMSFSCGNSTEDMVLVTNIGIQMEALAARMTSPQLVRLIFYGSSRSNLLVLNILTQRIRFLPQDILWSDPHDFYALEESERSSLSSEVENSPDSAESET